MNQLCKVYDEVCKYAINKIVGIDAGADQLPCPMHVEIIENISMMVYNVCQMMIAGTSTNATPNANASLSGSTTALKNWYGSSLKSSIAMTNQLVVAMQNSAGGNGHEGHIHVADYLPYMIMRSVVDIIRVQLHIVCDDGNDASM